MLEVELNILFMTGGARENTLRFLLEKKRQVIAVVTPYLTEKNKRFENVIAMAIEFGVPVLQVDRSNITETLLKLDYKILVSCGFSYLIPKEAINKAKYAINVHPTLLPKYRGYRSGPYIIINGEKKTGVTIHFISDEFDKGDIIEQCEIEVSPFDTTKSLFRRCQKVEGPLLHSVIKQLENKVFKASAQDESQATVYNYLRTPKDSEVDPSKSLMELYNHIRACDPNEYPAFFYVAGQKVCIKLWRPDKPYEEFDLI